MSYLKFLWDSVKFDLVYYLVVINIIIAYSFYVGLTYLSLVGLLCVSALLKSLFKEKRFIWASFLKSCSVIVLLVAAFWFLPLLVGWWFVWVLLFLFIAYRFFIGRKLIMSSMRFIERTLFGKSLDRKEFAKGEKPSIYKEEKE